MAVLSWNEIKIRAIGFSKEWENETKERAEAQSFWNDFFNVFGVNRRRVASFDRPVKMLDGRDGFVDLLWKGTMIVEHKSEGKDLDKAHVQALDYFPGLKDYELPKYAVETDFKHMVLHDIETNESHNFEIAKLHEHIKLFSFIAGYAKSTIKSEDPVNIKASELMGEIHDILFKSGFKGHPLEVFLVRILFCLFAEDTGIFDPNSFSDFLINKTNEDGSNVGSHLAYLFEVLNTSQEFRSTLLDEDIASFPYVNGKLFEERTTTAVFDSHMREELIKCTKFDWSKISPAVFGSLFQSVMDKEKRRNLGAHYTTEENILKMIGPLFLDELRDEFNKSKHNKTRLRDLHERIGALKFLDPACGCGNFLVVTYRELRMLEIDILTILYDKQLEQGAIGLDLESYLKLDVDQFYGIEIEEFPARIAEVALWLMDHQMSLLVGERLGSYKPRIPLRKSANIIIGDALMLDWKNIIPPNKLSFILGNPPFVGKQLRNKEQTMDQLVVMKDIKGSGVLDFVACWYIKAAQYIQGTTIKVAFVSTNSITQGEQVGILWNELFSRYNVKIHFAHRTFKWNSEARGKAAVHVVIIGFGSFDIENKELFEYLSVDGTPHNIKVKNISPYLIEGSDITVLSRSQPVSDVPKIVFGSMPNDGGNLLLTDEEKEQVVKQDPNIVHYIRPLISSNEYFKGLKRWCFWLQDVDINKLKNSRIIMDRIEKVQKYRENSPRKATRDLSLLPSLFGEIRQPKVDYLLIPSNCSETRNYIPICFMSKFSIANNSCLMIPDANYFHFGILQSIMHMTWMRQVAGRLKSDYRYSNKLVYNTFPWPIEITNSHKLMIGKKAKMILKIRQNFSTQSLALLYNPLLMPKSLLDAHRELDAAVDKCYRGRAFHDDRERIEYLFDLYEHLIQKE